MADLERLERALREADRQGNTEDARRLAFELRRAQMRQSRENAPTFLEDGQQIVQNVQEGAQQFNTGLLNMVPMPQGARDAIASTGISTTADPRGMGDIALRGTGEAVSLAGAGVAGLTGRAALGGPQHATRIANQGGVRGTAERIGQTVLDTARRRPGTFFAAEAAGGAGAAAGGEAGRRAGEENEGSAAAQALEAGGTLAGGLAAGVAPGVAGAGLQRAGRTLQKHLLPFTPGGSRTRASEQLQRTAENPEQAAFDALNGPEGVSAPRRTGDEGLMALEDRVLYNDPRQRARVRDNLGEAEARATEGFRNQFGEPVPRREWERGVMESVAAPEGVGGQRRIEGEGGGRNAPRIQPGDTDEMLQQAFETYGPAYNAARGHSINPMTIGVRMSGAIEDPEAGVGESIRREVGAFLNSHLSNLQRTRVREDGTLLSDDILDLRHLVRSRQRSLAGNTDDTSEQRRRLLDNVERELTGILDEQLPREVAEGMRATDGKYRQYKVVEDAVFRGGEQALSPERMSESIRRNSRSPGEFARGGDQELRQRALSGRGAESVLGSPDDARRMTRGMSEEQLRPVKADFAQTLFRRASQPDDDGVPRLSGRRLRSEIEANRETGRALGLSDDELERMTRMADELVMIQRPSPGANSGKVIDDQLAAITELGGRLAGARAGQNLSSGGIGGALVLAQHMSSQAVRRLKRLTTGGAEKLMARAVEDPDLFSSLMTGPTASAEAKREAGSRLNAWLLNEAGDNDFDWGEQQEEPPPPAPQPQQSQPRQQPRQQPQQSRPQGRTPGLLDNPTGRDPTGLRGLLQ